MKAPSSQSQIPLTDFYLYLIGPAGLAGFAIVSNPTWPVVIGILALCAIVASVFCFVWSWGGLETSEDAAQPVASTEEKA